MQRTLNLSEGTIRKVLKRNNIPNRIINPVKHCLNCNKKFDTFAGRWNEAKFCSPSCWYDYRHKNKLPSGTKKDYIKRGKKSFKTKIKELKKFPSKYQNPNYYTNIEKIMKKILLEMNLKENIDFFHNKIIYAKNIPRFPDFLIPKIRLIIECDGYFHDFDKDFERDRDLTSLGYYVLHFHYKEIFKKKDKVREVVKLYVDKIKMIKFVGKKEVGDLSMKQNHNFILENGLVVHNTETHTGAGSYAE